MKKIVAVSMVVMMMALGLGISSSNAQQQSQQPQGAMMHQGMMMCPMMTQMAQTGTGQGMPMSPMMHRGCMMMHTPGHGAPQPQTPPPAVPSN